VALHELAYVAINSGVVFILTSAGGTALFATARPHASAAPRATAQAL
jgi:hypothetical protein